MDGYGFVISPEEAESAAKRHGISVVNLLPLLFNPENSCARPSISKFHVGAVGLGSSGRIFLGVNVEFRGLPLHQSIHAEQFLIANLALNSEQHIRYLCASSRFSVSAAPCGHCRQFLQEIRDAPEIEILITDPNSGEARDRFVRLESLLPHRFSPDRFLEQQIPLLLDPRDNRLSLSDLDREISNTRTVSDYFSNLKLTALAAANRSYAPYSKSPSGVALVDSEGKVYRGWYMESVAYNPSLGPVQAALVDFVANGGGQGYERIVGAVMVEKEDAVVCQEHTARLILKTISPNCDLKIFHRFET